MNLDRLCLAFQGEGSAGLECVCGAVEQEARGLCQQQGLAELTRRVLNAGGDVHGIADHPELGQVSPADRPDEHEPRVDPDPDPAALAEVRVD